MVEDFILSGHELESDVLGDCLNQSEMFGDQVKHKSPFSPLLATMEVVFS